MDLQSLFTRALALQQSGQLAEAEPLYRQILAVVPGDFATQLLLGILCATRGRNDEALALIEAALALDPQSELALLNYGNVLGTMGRNDAALAAYDRALAANPASVDALNNRGVLLWNMQRWGEALASYDRALALNPAHAEAHNNRGNVLQDLNRLDDAMASYDRALELRADFAQAHNNRANALRKLKQLDAALASAGRALAIQPDYADAMHNCANILLDMQRPDAALANFDAVLAMAPRHAPAWNGKGRALHRLRRFGEALAALDAALSINPASAEALNDRGNTLQELDRLDDAVASYDAALRLKPGFLDALNNRSNAWRGLHRFDAALEDLERALAIAPGNAQAWWSKSILKLQQGDLAEGLRLYEWRKKMPAPIEARGYAQPLWTGAEDIAGKTLFVYNEQGLGDAIQFYRYAVMARARGARVILSLQDTAMQLIRDAGDDIEVIGLRAVPDGFDYHIPLMSLPLAFGTTLQTIPATTPYLRAQPQRVRQWRSRIGEDGFRIGVCWQGAPTVQGRAFPPSCLSQISALPGVRLISLQKGEGAGPSLPVMETLGVDFDAGPDAFLDSAAVMESLDLVISADTSVAHLAGALNRPVWLALKHTPDWRWFLDRADTPWYPAMRLFRQPAPGDWASVFAAVTSALLRDFPIAAVHHGDKPS
jgi:tetratricopeptide (TPR) repeat protein